MSQSLKFEVSQKDYASVPDYLTKSLSDFGSLSENYQPDALSEILAMMYRAECGNDENVIQRLIALSEMSEEDQRIENKALRKEYAQGRSYVEELSFIHRIARGAPLEYRPVSTTDANRIIETAPWLSHLSKSVVISHGDSTVRAVDPGMAAYIIKMRSNTPDDTAIETHGPIISLDLMHAEDRALCEEAKVAVRVASSHGLNHPRTMPYFMMNLTDGRPKVFLIEECEKLEQQRKRPERMRLLWSLKEKGHAYEIKSHNPDYAAWVIPAWDGYGNIILATHGEKAEPIAHEDDLSVVAEGVSSVGLRQVRERYVSPEFRGKGLGLELIVTREKTPLLSRVITGSGFFSPGGYASRMKAYKVLTQNEPKPECAPQAHVPASENQEQKRGVTAKGQTPTPF